MNVASAPAVWGMEVTSLVGRGRIRRRSWESRLRWLRLCVKYLVLALGFLSGFVGSLGQAIFEVAWSLVAFLAFGQSDANRFQSLFQLGIGVCLAYLAAGPTVHGFLVRQLTRMTDLSRVMEVLARAETPRDSGPNEMAERLEILRTLSDIMEREHKRELPTRDTYGFYVAVGIVLLGALILSSFDTGCWPNPLVSFLTVLVSIAIFYEPWVVWKRSEVPGTLLDVVTDYCAVLEPHLAPYAVRLDKLQRIHLELLHYQANMR